MTRFLMDQDEYEIGRAPGGSAMKIEVTIRREGKEPCHGVVVHPSDEFDEGAKQAWIGLFEVIQRRFRDPTTLEICDIVERDDGQQFMVTKVDGARREYTVKALTEANRHERNLTSDRDPERD